MGCCESSEDPENRHLLSSNNLIQTNSYYYSDQNTFEDIFTSRSSIPWSFDENRVGLRIQDKNTSEHQVFCENIIKDLTSKLIDMSQGDDILNQRYQENPYISKLYVYVPCSYVKTCNQKASDAIQTTRLTLPTIFSLPNTPDTNNVSIDPVNCDEDEWFNRSANFLVKAIEATDVKGNPNVIDYLSQE